MSVSKPKRLAITGWKLWLGGLVALLLLLIFAHAVWTTVERNRVRQRLDALRAAKVPIDARDLVEADVPDANNLVVPIRAAIAAFAREDVERQSRRQELERADAYHAFEWPLTDDEVALLRAEQAADGAALEAIAGVDGRTGVAWRDPLTAGPLILRVDKEYVGARRVATLLADAARLAARDGRSLDALVALGRIPKVAEAIAAKPMLIASLVAVGCQSLAADRAMDVAPTLDAQSGSPARAAAVALIARFLDDAAILRVARAGLVSERVFVHDTFAAVRSGTLGLKGFGPAPAPGERFAALVFAPALHRSEGAILDAFAEAIAIADAPDLAAHGTRADRLREAMKATQAGPMTIFASIFMPALDRPAVSTYRLLTDRHLAATALAIRLYQLDHGGARPATLDALVPAYLPAVPTDAIDGKPLRYDAGRAILWSVGEDEKDDGGDESAAKPSWSGVRWKTKDAVVPLDTRPRPVAEASE